jgi:hypothetical protein
MTETLDTSVALTIGCLLVVAGMSAVTVGEVALLGWIGVFLSIALLLVVVGPRAYERLTEV